MKKIYHIPAGIIGLVIINTLLLTSCTSKISEEEARKIALNDSNISTDQLTSIKINEEVKDNEKVYDITFQSDNKEYYYTISKTSGKIIQSKISNTETSVPSNQADPHTPINKNTNISAEEAKKIALKHANAKVDDVQLLECKKDIENNINVYSIEFYIKNNEYEYDISCKDGKIIKHTIDTEPLPTNQFKISIDKAEDSALSRVPGATKRDIHISCEFDENSPIYEGKIRYKGFVYEFEIDAINGNFLEWSKKVEN